MSLHLHPVDPSPVESYQENQNSLYPSWRHAEGERGFSGQVPTRRASTHLWTLFCLRWKRAGERGRDLSPEACVILPHFGTVQNPLRFRLFHFILILIWDRETQGKWGLEGLLGSPGGYLY